jgi:hypothetical protein
LYILPFVLEEQGLQTPFIITGLSVGQDDKQNPLSFTLFREQEDTQISFSLYIFPFLLEEQGLHIPFIISGLSGGQDATQTPSLRLDLSGGQFSVALRHFLSSLLPEAQDATHLPFSR